MENVIVVSEPKFESKASQMIFTLLGQKLIVYRSLYVQYLPGFCNICKHKI